MDDQYYRVVCLPVIRFACIIWTIIYSELKCTAKQWNSIQEYLITSALWDRFSGRPDDDSKDSKRVALWQ
jgi:hypothetical protein